MPEKDRNKKKETLTPSTAAMDGRRNSRAYIDEYRMNGTKTQAVFYARVVDTISTERLSVYGDCRNEPKIVLARYLLNMALCESLYAHLQFCEVALRNSIHADLVRRYGCEDWYDCPSFALSPWATQEVQKAKEKIEKAGKETNPGRIVAELQFGFWSSLFEAHYEQHTSFMPQAIKSVFPYMPKSLHSRKRIKASLETIRTLRNRVFHHERIVHWRDLDDQHNLLQDIIGWINPELLHLADYLDRYRETRSNGLDPWLAHLDSHWTELCASSVRGEYSSYA